MSTHLRSRMGTAPLTLLQVRPFSKSKLSGIVKSELLQVGCRCRSCHPINSDKALKDDVYQHTHKAKFTSICYRWRTNSTSKFLFISVTAFENVVCPLPANTKLGMVEICAKILQIMRNDFKDYARTFCQLCALYVHLFQLCITRNWHSTIKRTF